MYITSDQVEQSINYFKELNLSSERLGLFLVLKRMGISTTRAYDFNDKESDELFLNALWMYGGIFDTSESAGKYTVLFPDNLSPDEFNQNSFFNGGSKFTKLRGRTKDSMRNQNPRLFIANNNSKAYRLIRSYRDILTTSVLKGDKVSFFYFAVWLFRFQFFDIPTSNKSNESLLFTRVLKKAARDYMRLSEDDFRMIFTDDFPLHQADCEPNPITGSEYRLLLGLSDNGNVEFEVADKQGDSEYPLLKNPISKDKVDRFQQATSDNPTNEQIGQVLKFKKQLILTGVPGVGKTYYINQLAKNYDHTVKVQFHPSYSYDEFIGGETLEDSSIIERPGKFLTAILDAKRNPQESYLFVIDEINRGNIAEIFGETIQILDRKDYEVELPRTIDGTKKISLPDNMDIIGAMNSSDRSIALLDLAIRRRFAFVELKPNYELISSLVKFENYDLGAILELINNRIIELTGDDQKVLGQSYMMPDMDSQGIFDWKFNQFHIQFNSMILPTLKEYALNDSNVLSGIIGGELANNILDDNEFKEAFNREFSFARIENEE